MNLIESSIPTINTYDPSNPKITRSVGWPAGVCALNQIGFEDPFCYCLFSCENSFKIYKISDIFESAVIDKLKSKEAFLILDNALEPFIRTIDSIYQNIILRDGIPSSQIILITNVYDIKDRNRKVAENFNVSPIRIFWYPVFELDIQLAIKHIYRKNIPKTLENKKYEKKFLNLNRRWRLHRPILFSLMYSRNLLGKGFISFGPCDRNDNWKSRWPEMMHYFRNNPEMTELLLKSKHVRKIPPFYLDTDKLHINRATCTVDTNRYYENSYFSVVSETTCLTGEWYDSARFLSEKAFKPIGMKHPFIVVSVPNTLEIYRIMGYKTFSSIINESYDLELDDAKRLLMVLDEIERLSNLNETQLADFLVKAREICEYNYQVLMSKDKFITELH